VVVPHISSRPAFFIFRTTGVWAVRTPAAIGEADRSRRAYPPTGRASADKTSAETNLLIDVNGYFAPPATGGLQLYAITPCRVLDTRSGSGAFTGELTVNVIDSSCKPNSAAKAYVSNATVIPPAALGYLTLWPNDEAQPTVSTLNAPNGLITSNMAIVPTSNGSIDAYANDKTQLLLDISGYFAP
jgi:hypothetical protein